PGRERHQRRDRTVLDGSLCGDGVTRCAQSAMVGSEPCPGTDGPAGADELSIAIAGWSGVIHRNWIRSRRNREPPGSSCHQCRSVCQSDGRKYAVVVETPVRPGRMGLAMADKCRTPKEAATTIVALFVRPRRGATARWRKFVFRVLPAVG